MSEKFKRSINYYEIHTKKKSKKVIDYLKKAVKKINHNERYKAKNRFRALSTGSYLQVTKITETPMFFAGCAKMVRNEFPVISDKKKGTVTKIAEEDDDDKGIPEETHFVICIHKSLSKPIIAIESTLKGPRENNISSFLSYALRDMDVDDDFNLIPIFAFDINKLEERINGVAKIKMSFHRDNIEDFNELDPETGSVLAAAIEYADSEYITLEFGINFQKIKERYPTKSLKDRFLKLLGVVQQNPKAKDLIKKLEVRAPDSLYENKIRLFDLIQSKVASEVTAERRRPRVQYFESTGLHNAIKNQILNDFDLTGEE